MPATQIPETHRAVTPYIIVNGADHAIDFYKVGFGATELVRLADASGKIWHAEIVIGGARGNARR